MFWGPLTDSRVSILPPNQWGFNQTDKHHDHKRTHLQLHLKWANILSPRTLHSPLPLSSPVLLLLNLRNQWESKASIQWAFSMRLHQKRNFWCQTLANTIDTCLGSVMLHLCCGQFYMSFRAQFISVFHKAHIHKSLFLSTNFFSQRNKVHSKITDQRHHMPIIKKKNTRVWKFMLRFPQQLFHCAMCNINHSIPKCFKRLQEKKGWGDDQVIILGGMKRYSLFSCTWILPIKNTV